MSQLVKCTSCARHVRVSESACPFCAAALDVEGRTAQAAVLAARVPTARMGRAALLAIGLGVAAPLTAACGNDDDDTTHMATPAYGIAPQTDASADGATDEPDGSTTPDASASTDASLDPDATTFPTPAYGLAGDAGIH